MSENDSEAEEWNYTKLFSIIVYVAAEDTLE